ncbi:MAG: hypothetical protein JO110_15650 [Acetobacteraceae bacterium]|nr:hypothetical protein [Acetobacteraceae bacterium]
MASPLRMTAGGRRAVTPERAVRALTMVVGLGVSALFLLRATGQPKSPDNWDTCFWRTLI